MTGLVRQHGTALVAVVATVELVLIVVLAVRRYRWGRPLRSGVAALRRAATAVARELALPVTALVRYRRGLHVLRTALTDPELPLVLAAASGSLLQPVPPDPGRPGQGVGAVPAPSGPQPGREQVVAVEVGRHRLRVLVAGPPSSGDPVTPPAPWQVDQPADGPGGGRRSADRDLLRDAAATPSAEHCRVAIGWTTGAKAPAAEFLDLAAVPGVLTVVGDPAVARAVVCAIGAQVDSGLGGGHPNRLVVVDGLLADAGGLPLAEALQRAEALHVGESGLVVLVGSLDDRSGLGTPVERLIEVVSRRPRLRAVLVGDVPASRWRLEVASTGRLTAPALDLDVDAGPLAEAVAAVLRRPAPTPVRVPDPPAPADPTLASGALASGALASGALASGAPASGAPASGAPASAAQGPAAAAPTPTPTPASAPAPAPAPAQTVTLASLLGGGPPPVDAASDGDVTRATGTDGGASTADGASVPRPAPAAPPREVPATLLIEPARSPRPDIDGASAASSFATPADDED